MDGTITSRATLEPTPGEVLERYRADAGQEPVRGCGPKAPRVVWSVAYELPAKLPRKHVTHTTATDARGAKREVLRHLPEGSRVITAEPTRSARRRGGEPRPKKPKRNRGKRAK